MKKKLFMILLSIGISVFVVTGCQKATIKTEHTNETAVEKSEDMTKCPQNTTNRKEAGDEVSAIKDTSETNVDAKETSSATTSSKGATTQTASSSGSSATTSTNKNTSSGNKTESHTHTWVAQTQTVSHAEEGHYETKVIQAAYDEEVYAWRTLCNRCTDPETGLPLDITGHAIDHVVIICGGGYYADRVVVDTIHHDAITEQVWVVDKAAWIETITIGYECSCGALK